MVILAVVFLCLTTILHANEEPGEFEYHPTQAGQSQAFCADRLMELQDVTRESTP